MDLLRAFLYLVLLCCAFASQTPFELGGLVAGPGTIISDYINVPGKQLDDGKFDEGVRIPVSIVNGARAGPVLLVIAGVHGSEYVPIVTLQRLLLALEPQNMSGTVILVHIANPPAFYGRTIYVSPRDGKNLNRVFPGDENGTISDRIAHVMSTVLIPRADAVIDVHCGDANESLLPFTLYYTEIGSDEFVERCRQLVNAFGVPRIVQCPFKVEKGGKSTYCAPTAAVRGIPSFDVEVGQLGQVDESLVETILNGLQSVMCEMRILDGRASPVINPDYISKRDHYYSEHDGLFYNLVAAGEQIKAGQKIGYITDPFANTVQDVFAKNSGTVLLIVARPAIISGEWIATIAVHA